MISRHYAWKIPSPIPESTNPNYVAGLILEVEGCDTPWGGDPKIFKIINYKKTYEATVSHLQFSGFAKRRSNDENPPSYGADGVNYRYSGIYFRGGGAKFRLTSNWNFVPTRLPDENDANSEVILHTHQNTQFFATRIPFTELNEPEED